MSALTAGDAVADFEPHRRVLQGLAYRMLGSWSEAEDMVQEAWLRWRDVDRAQVDAPRAYLSRTVTRLCLDYIKSARAREYVGPWLPEPLPDAGLYGGLGEGALAHDLSVALMLALERLSAPERAAFLLHDVFDQPYSEVARTLGRNEASCRQLALRARERVRERGRASRPPSRTACASPRPSCRRRAKATWAPCGNCWPTTPCCTRTAAARRPPRCDRSWAATRWRASSPASRASRAASCWARPWCA